MIKSDEAMMDSISRSILSHSQCPMLFGKDKQKAD
jgi:hypothetical protein